MSKKVGRFGDFGGQYVPETVMNAVHELEQAYDFYKNEQTCITTMQADLPCFTMQKK